MSLNHGGEPRRRRSDALISYKGIHSRIRNLLQQTEQGIRTARILSPKPLLLSISG